MAERGVVKAGDTVVCTITGHGLKDPDNAIEISSKPVSIPARLDAVLAAMEL
jgi:threonine synthase